MTRVPGRWAGALIGAVAGVLSGMLGIGGGLVVTPVLALRGVPLRKATGTALGAVLVCTLVAVVTEALTEPAQLHVLVALAVAVGAQFGVIVGRKVLKALPDTGLRVIFLIFLLFAAANSLGVFDGAGADELATTGAARNFQATLSAGNYLFVVGVGLAAGISSVLFGIGGGVIVVPFLMLLGADFREAAAVSLMTMVPTALTGLWVAHRDDRIERGLLTTLLPTAALGAVVGVWLRNRALESPVLEMIFGIFLLYAAGRLWMSRPRPRPRRRSG